MKQEPIAKAPCMGCGKSISAKHMLCVACAEEMGIRDPAAAGPRYG